MYFGSESTRQICQKVGTSIDQYYHIFRHRFQILQFVDHSDNRLLSQIDDLLGKFKNRRSSPDDLNNQKAFRERSIYNTLAIEGNTMSLKEVSTVLNTNTKIKGHNDQEHLEIRGMDEVFKFIDGEKEQGRRFSTKALTLEVCEFNKPKKHFV